MLGGPPLILASPEFWGHCCNQAASSPVDSPELSLETAIWWQASAFLHNCFNPGASTSTQATLAPMAPQTWFQALTAPLGPVIASNPVPPGNLSHITKFSCQHKVQSWPHLEWSFCVLTPRNHFLDYCTSLMLVSS